jgi:hypothetical protein
MAFDAVFWRVNLNMILDSMRSNHARDTLHSLHLQFGSDGKQAATNVR